MTPAMEARGLNLKRGGSTVLRDVSFQLRTGELTCLLGPNGAGKSTLIEVLAGSLKAGSGEVFVEGRPISALSPNERARALAIVGREAHGTLTLPVRAVVELGRLPYLRGARLSPEDHSIVEAGLLAQNCLKFAARPLHTLSDGERQRVHWARALCQTPKTLLLDEATAHLDLAQRERQFERARRFAEEGGAVLAVAHDLDLALRHAHRILVMNEGKLVADDSPEHALTPDLLWDVFGVDARVIEQDGDRTLLIRGVREPHENDLTDPTGKSSS
jgi:iron complex transport system ATP-binding protein